ncbi:hypothetical protein IU479_34650 [Nocardia abscessus]|uniref:hypothetical protein n=1 Tax=Nocardia TaxID=1817 RepID=UPI001895BE3A|nr:MULTISPECIES: hypothetical protein [Nocardia]MBF6223217.1 hypothetical protein [Nocardia abscessus]MDE1674271.1 hypothetical protein [Nocardia gipuzkoensis]
MTHPNLLERYQARRTRRFEFHAERWAHMLPRWRTRRRRRLLVVALATMFLALAVVAVLIACGLERGPLLWAPVCVAFFPLWISLQIVSGRQADAPVGALDEWEIEQRNAARSVGLTLTQTLAMIPAIWLIVVGGFTDLGNIQAGYAGGVMLLTALLVGGCTPTMILAWTRPDAEPEDE